MKEEKKIFEDVWVTTVCGRCYGNCAIRVRRINGVAVKIEGVPESPMGSRGGVCAKGLSGLQVLYDPNRLNKPLKRTNPEKGLFVDPHWTEISWDEALSEMADRLKKVLDEDPQKLLFQGTTGRGTFLVTHMFPLIHLMGRPSYYFGGAGLHCGNGAHPVAGMMHGSWSIVPDFKYCNYAVYFGANKGGGSGHSAMITARLAADARARGARFVVFDPMANHAGGKATDWIPLIPGTDGAVALAMCNVIVNDLGKYDKVYLKTKTNGPYLISPDGKYARDKKTGKCLVWDVQEGKAVPYDHRSIPSYATACEIDYALEGKFEVNGITCRPAFELLRDHLKNYTPEKAAEASHVPARTIRRVAAEFADAAQVGSTVTMGGEIFPLRPASAVIFRGGQGHENSFHSCFAVHLLNQLVGSADVPGGTVGWPARCLGFPETGRLKTSPYMGKDGLLTVDRFGTTSAGIKRKGPWPPNKPELLGRASLMDIFTLGHNSMVFASSDQDEIWQKVGWGNHVEMLISWGCNTVMSVANPEIMEKVLKKIPYIVVSDLFSTELAEGFADLLLPDTSYLEVGSWAEGAGMNFNHPFGTEDWMFQVSQPVVEPKDQRRDFWGDVMPEVVDRMGKRAQFNEIRNQLYEIKDDLKLKPEERLTSPELSDRVLKTFFGPEHGWDWFKQNGFITWPKQLEEAYWRYLVDCRVPIYLEFLIEMGEEVAKIASKTGLELDLSHYTPLISWFPCTIHRIQDPAFDLYCFSYRDVLHSGTYTMEQPWLDEASHMTPYTYNIVMHADTAHEKKLAEGDVVQLQSIEGRTVRGRLKLMQGIQERAVTIAACSGHWAKGMPIARGKGTLFNILLENDLKHSDHICLNIETAVRVKIEKAG